MKKKEKRKLTQEQKDDLVIHIVAIVIGLPIALALAVKLVGIDVLKQAKAEETTTRDELVGEWTLTSAFFDPRNFNVTGQFTLKGETSYYEYYNYETIRGTYMSPMGGSTGSFTFQMLYRPDGSSSLTTTTIAQASGQGTSQWIPPQDTIFFPSTPEQGNNPHIKIISLSASNSESMLQNLLAFLTANGQKEASEDYTNGYNDGYEAGKNAGWIEGWNIGQQQGYQNGYIDGYSQGYSDGETASENFTFKNLLFATIDAPINVLKDMLNFDLLGYNMLSFFTAIITVLIFSKILSFFI